MARPRKVTTENSPGAEATQSMIASLEAVIRDAEDLRMLSLAEGVRGLPSAARALEMRQQAEEKLARMRLISAAQDLGLAAKLDLDAILAAGDGSWIALGAIRKTQAAHAEEVERIRAARSEAEMATLGADELVGVIVGAIAEASIEDVRRIMDAAQSRLTPRLVEG